MDPIRTDSSPAPRPEVSAPAESNGRAVEGSANPGTPSPEDHRAALLRYAAHLLSDTTRAQDVVQDTFARYWAQPPELHAQLMGRTHSGGGDAPGSTSGGTSGGGADSGGAGGGGRMKAWLFTVCRNRAFDVRKKERRMTALTPPIADAQAHQAPGPARLAEQRDTHRHVLDRLAQLPGAQQEVVRLKFQGELSYKQIAEVTGLTVSHVGNLLHHALKTLRQELATPD